MTRQAVLAVALSVVATLIVATAFNRPAAVAQQPAAAAAPVTPKWEYGYLLRRQDRVWGWNTSAGTVGGDDDQILKVLGAPAKAGARVRTVDVVNALAGQGWELMPGPDEHGDNLQAAYWFKRPAR